MSTHHARIASSERRGHPQPEPEVKHAILASWVADAAGRGAESGPARVRDVPGASAK